MSEFWVGFGAMGVIVAIVLAWWLLIREIRNDSDAQDALAAAVKELESANADLDAENERIITEVQLAGHNANAEMHLDIKAHLRRTRKAR